MPHPRMLERAFVLIPLLDMLEPHHPDYEKLSAITEGLPDKEGVKDGSRSNCQTRKGVS